jgi:hypothetical protein
LGSPVHPPPFLQVGSGKQEREVRERKSWKEKGKGKRTRLRHRRNIRKRRSWLIEVIINHY